MAKRIAIGLVALILVIAGIVWLVNREDEGTATPVLSVAAFNQTTGTSVTETVSTNDTIIYTLTAENQSDEVISGYIIEANISEITDKATLVDASGASYNSATNSLVWTPLDIPPHESISQKFTVRVNPLAAGTMNTALKIRFNNELALAIQQPIVSGSVSPSPVSPDGGYIAPTTGASEWMPAIFALIATLSFFGIRKYRLVRSLGNSA